MKQIALISCVAKKLNGKHPAYKLYSPSTLFKAHWNYALKVLKLDPRDSIFIISAKHHLISPLQEIEKYDVTLKNMSKEERKKWAEIVTNQLSERFDLNNTEFLILAGKDYYEELIKNLPHYKLIPAEPLPIGKRVQWFNNEVKKVEGLS